MGFFDKLFKKKKTAPVRPPRSQTPDNTGMTPREVRPITTQPLPVKQPPGYPQSVPKTPVKHRPPPTRKIVRIDEEKLAAKEVQREIEKSVARIPASKHEPIKKPGVPGEPKKPVKAKKMAQRADGGVHKPKQVKIARDRLPTGANGATGTAGVKTATTTDAKAFEDVLGEEELFKKLAQWDKDLKKRPVHKKIGVKTPSTNIGTPTKTTSAASAGIGVMTRPDSAGAGPGAAVVPKMDEAELVKREEKLRALEAKLLEREKKLKEKEELDKVFTDLEISELEGFKKGESAAGGELTEDLKAKEERLAEWEEEIKKREEEIKRAGELTIELEAAQDLLQPLKNLNFTNFIVGPSNRFAHDVALAVAKAPADAYNPLFIYSEVGLGKTHLLCAIGNYIKSKDENVRIVYASSEKFTNELLDYLRLGEMEKFRIKYRNVDVLLIDDIQFIGGQEGTQEEFFHTFNALYNNHKQIVITSDRPPKNIAHLKDRLRSRFEGGLIVNIKPPDLGTRTRILHEKAERDGIYIPEEIINYIAGKIKSNVRTLIGILNRVVAHSSLTDRDLDTKLVDEVLTDVLDERAELPVD